MTHSFIRNQKRSLLDLGCVQSQPRDWTQSATSGSDSQKSKIPNLKSDQTIQMWLTACSYTEHKPNPSLSYKTSINFSKTKVDMPVPVYIFKLSST